MSIKVFDESIDIAVVGLTNSGKSSFISTLFNEKSFPNPESIVELRKNDGGLTKVTTFYNLIDCQTPIVSEVEFNRNAITRGIDSKDIDSLNTKLNNSPYKSFNIDPVEASEDGTYTHSLTRSLNNLESRIRNDFELAIKFINSKDADILIKHIKIDIPADSRILNLMRKYEFSSLTFRDTRGFLDIKPDEIIDKAPTLYDTSLDGIQACIFMNGQDSVMPNVARDIYGEFVKSIFESVPCFIVERNAKLAGKLEDYIDDNVTLIPSLYEGLVTNKRITDLNFREVNKFLSSLGILDKAGNSVNQLIDENKRELLLPEVRFLKNNYSDNASSDSEIYEFCVFEVIDNLLKSLYDFRATLRKIMSFFDDYSNLNAVQTSVMNTFQKEFLPQLINEYCEYKTHSYQLVRPVTQGFTTELLLDNMMNSNLLGKRGGITTKKDGIYLYGATGVLAATSWNTINRIITNLKNYETIVDTITQLASDENSKIIELYILHVQQFMKYTLQNFYTDIYAHFSGYPILERYNVQSCIYQMRNVWNEEYSEKYGENAVDTVYLKMIRELIDQNFSEEDKNVFNYVRFSQLYISFANTLHTFFNKISDNDFVLSIENITSV